MALFQRPTELAKLSEQRTQLEKKAAAAVEEFAGLRSVSADERLDAFLSGAELGENRTRIAALEGQLEDLNAAKRALMGRIRTAMLAGAHEKAEKKRADAKKIQSELDKHQARTDELLAQLKAHDAVEYGPKGAIGLMPVPGQLLPVPLTVRSRSAELAAQIATLNAAADAIEAEAAQSVKGGRAVGESLEELLLGATQHPLAPSEREIRAWFAEASARADCDWARNEATWLPAVDRGATRFTVVWNGGGAIDAAQSTTVNSHVSRPQPITERPAYNPEWRGRVAPRGWHPAA